MNTGNGSGNSPLPPIAGSIRSVALLAGLVGAGLCVVGALADPHQFGRSYLYAYIFFLGLSLGSLALLMLHRQVGGAWGMLIRRPLESGAMTLPLMALLFLPIALNMKAIYPWVAHPISAHVPEGGHPTSAAALPIDEVKHDTPANTPKLQSTEGTSRTLDAVSVSPSMAKRANRIRFRDDLEKTNADRLQFKSHWLQPTNWMIRAGIYFAIWIVLAVVLNQGSKAQDRDAAQATNTAYRLQAVSGVGLVLYFLSVSFALVDWGMSLDPEWYSSIYGVLIIVGQGVSTMAFMILIAAMSTLR